MNIGVVVIGRNEGERLRRCLESVTGFACQVVYVDSGSIDGSVAMARAMGVEVIDLDMTIPFCAARARNAGYERLVQCHTQLRFIQFIDGDCEIIGNWLSEAAAELEKHPELAIVTGWLRERSPEVSIYNRLGELEWNSSAAGEVSAVGGIFMIRCEAFDSVGGFNPTVPAGEEPELCQRLTRRGWRIKKLDRSMAWHDLAIVSFGQWWMRMVRFGSASMDLAERFMLLRYRRNNLIVRFWTAWLVMVLNVGLLTVALPLQGVSVLLALMLFSLWPAQLCRIAYRTLSKGHPFGLASAYAFFIMVSFLPQIAGQLMYWNDHLRNRSPRLIEYKAPTDFDTRRGNYKEK